MIIKGVIALLTLFIIPEILGMLILNFWKEQKNNVILAFVLGYIIEFAIGQLISVPLIFIEGTLTKLVTIYVSIILVLTIISIIVNRNRIKEIVKNLIENIKTMPILETVILFIMIGMQLFVVIKYSYINDDDAYYVATATTSVQTDTLFKYSAMTGSEEKYEQYLMRYRIGPFPLYYAIQSKILDIHPAIVAHFILPLIFIPTIYMIYWLFAKEFFKDNKKLAVLFMIFVCFLHIFSYYSGKNNLILVLLRIWQGKAILANIIIPLILILFLYGEKENFNIVSIIALFITILAGNFTTTMAIAMTPACLMLLTISYELVKLISKQTQIKKSLVIFLKNLICCMPSMVYGLIYFFK